MRLLGSNDPWRDIRRTRSSSQLADRQREPLYRMALEQAEQQFRAAAQLPLDSRPISLFYGLSQAARAISAALTPAKDRYELTGHGINFKMASRRPCDLHLNRTIGTTGEMESFQHLSTLLHSDPLTDGAELGAIWSLLADDEALDIAEDYPPVIHPRYVAPSIPAATRRDRLVLPTEQFEANVSNLPFHPDRQNLLDTYPDIAEIETLAVTEDALVRATVKARFRPLAGNPVLVPKVSSQSHKSMHPLMAWWAVLHALSVLARYEPRLWTQLINVNESTVAVDIFTLSEKALRDVPLLICDLLAHRQHAAYCDQSSAAFSF